MQDNYVAMMDQGKAGAADMGRLVAAFWRSLVAEGVPEDQAGEITAAYCSATVRNCGRRKA